MATTKKSTGAKPTLTSLKKALAEEQAHNEKLQKDLASEKSSKEYYNKLKDVSDKEVESIHSLLDVLPGALARKTVADPEQSWNVTTHNLITRFAAYLANGNK